LLFWSVNDIDKKIEASLQFQHALEKASMKLIQSQVQESRSKKRKARVVDDDDADVNQHDGLLLLPEIVAEFPSLLSLAVHERKAEMMEDNTAADDANVTEQNAAIVMLLVINF